MVSKLFLLGRPGSGKSTVRRYITKLAHRQFLSPYPIYDYKILHNMCMADPSHVRICPAEFGGFEVLDFSILNTALHIIERRVEKALERHRLALPRLAIIEFARDDYLQALSQFAPDFLKDAHFLILESDIDTCMDRINRRIRYPECADDTFVPINIMEEYYYKDTTPDRIRKIQESLGLNDHQFQLVYSDGPRDNFLHDYIRAYFQSLIEPVCRARCFVMTSNNSHSTDIAILRNCCPPPSQDNRQVQEVNEGEQVKEQPAVTFEKELVGSGASSC